MNCPKCCSKSLSVTLLSYSEGIDPNRWRCLDCGYAWRECYADGRPWPPNIDVLIQMKPPEPKHS